MLKIGKSDLDLSILGELLPLMDCFIYWRQEQEQTIQTPKVTSKYNRIY